MSFLRLCDVSFPSFSLVVFVLFVNLFLLFGAFVVFLLFRGMTTSLLSVCPFFMAWKRV